MCNQKTNKPSKRVTDEAIKEAFKARVDSDITILSPEEDSFKFTCVACGECCHNRNESNTIMLSPYDVFQLVKHRKNKALEPVAFIKKHIGFYIGNDSGYVIAYLKTKDLFDGRNICTFLKKRSNQEGYYCSVHAHKPTVCRIFPLGRMLQQDGDIVYVLQHNVECMIKTPEEKRETHKLDDWIPDKENLDKAFIANTELITSIYEIIDLAYLQKSNLQEKTIDLINNGLVSTLYYDYDYDKDFFEQFETHKTTLLEILKKSVTMLSKADPKIGPRRKKNK